MELVAAFADPHELKIKHVTQPKPLLKPEDRAARVLAEAGRLAESKGQGAPLKPADVIRRLAAAADPPKKAPKKSGSKGQVVSSAAGAPLLRIDAKKPKEVTLTLLLAGGGSREDAEGALRTLLETVWPSPSPTV